MRLPNYARQVWYDFSGHKCNNRFLEYSPTAKAKKIFSENDIAIKYDCEIWTNDKHFKLMKTVLPTLRLYLE